MIEPCEFIDINYSGLKTTVVRVRAGVIFSLDRWGDGESSAYSALSLEVTSSAPTALNEACLLVFLVSCKGIT
jgi:hypothetical protein